MTRAAAIRAALLVCFTMSVVLPALSQSVTVSPTSISFGNQAEGTPSSVQKLTLKNGQKSAITVTSIGTNLSDYSQTNTCPVSPAALAAAASCTISITFNPAALGARNGTLTVVDTGTSSPQTATLTGTGTAPTLQSIAVTPSAPSVIAGYTQQFTATGTYSNGTTQNLTSSATWSSSSTSVAAVSTAGLATGIAAGTSTITAKSGSISGTTKLTVTAPTLTSISVTPASPSVAAGKTQPFTATGTYSNGTTQNLTSSSTWSSSATSIATVSAGGLATGVSVGTSTITAKSGSINGSTTLTVTAATLTSIAVTPASPSVAAGKTQQFTATGTYSNGTTQNLTSSAAWSSSTISIATVSAGGLATGVATGSSTITATSGTVSGSTTLTVTAAVLTSIAVNPANVSVAAGYTQQFTATGTYSNGTTQNLTSSATWSSSKTSVATVKSTTGLATTVAPGTATITAKSGTISGSATLTVTAAVLASISVTPTSASIAAGYTQQYTATGTYSNGTAQNLTSTASWNSSSTSIATVSAGLANAVSQGTATITATSGAVSGSSTLTVTPAVLTSISVTPGSLSLAAGHTQQFTATGNYSNGTTQNLTSTASWNSSALAVASVSGGLATAIAQGSTAITASSGTVSGSATLTVTAAVLTSISISPTTASVAAGNTAQFAATGNYSNGTRQSLTGSATWNSSATSVATVSGGLATSAAQGSATITASSGTISGSATLTVTAAVLTSISVTPNMATVAAGQSQQFAATGTYSDGTTQNLTGSSTWISSATPVATVNSSGFATSSAQGSVIITASSGSISGSANLSVTAPVLTSLAISPVSGSIAEGTSQQFTATGTYSDGSTQDLTSSVSWSSSSTSVANIATGGLATGSGVGTATITAADGSITASAALTVGQPVLVSLALTPANPSFALGTTLPLIATGTYSDGSTLVLTTSANWSTADSTVATVNPQGIASSVAVGGTTVTATIGAVTGSTALTITPAVLVSIAVTPAIPTIPLGTTQQFTATGTYTDSSTQNITATVQWNSDTPDVATISESTSTPGLASSVGQGTANISATSGSITGSTTITVTSAALVSIAVTPTAPSIALGTMQQFTAMGSFTDGSTQDLTSTATWSSDTASAATINNSGLAQSAGIGTANITANSGGISSSTLLTVTPAALVSIAINPQTATIPLGTTQQFTATGTFTDGTTQDLTQSGHWSSTAANVATISNTANSAGLASTLGTGTTTIAIASGSISAQATLIVNPAVLASIAITPQNPTIALGTTQQFTATGTYTDGSTQDLTSVATWASSDATVAIVGNAVGSYGLATSSGQGTATISATFSSISSSTPLTVSGPALVSIAISPASAAMPLGTSQQFYATGTYTDGSTQDLTASATWTSSQPSVAPVSAAGLVAATLFGTANISAASGSVSASASVTVTAPILISVSITPASASIPDGTSQQFSATGTYSDGSTQDLTSAASWSSSLTSVANVAAGGLANGAGVGTATITATEGSITASATLTVGQPVLVSIAVTAAGPSFALGTTQQLTATGTYSDGSTLILTTSAAWMTGDSTIATVNNQGIAESVAVGSTSVTATVGSISGPTTLNVSPAILVSIAVTPAIPTLALGTTQQFTATGTYTDGSTQDISSTVQWSSDRLATATIATTGATTGLATSMGEGTATITAASGSITGSTTVTVTAAALVSIVVTPATPAIALGTTQQFTATGTYTDGSIQNLSSMVQWSSDTPATATIGTTGATTGLATSLEQGTATITATSGSISGSTMITVTAAALVSIAITPPTATIAFGTTQQFTATGTFTDGTTQDLTQSGHWSSTAATVVTISNTAGMAGLATTLTVGTTTIGISSGTVSATATLVVNPAALVSIAINPQSPTIALGTAQQFTATGTYTDGSTQDLTSVATWASSNALIAVVENTLGSYGLATTSGQGTATISATLNSISSSTTLTVGQAALTSIAVSPSSIAVALGYGEQFTATATYSDGSTQDITQSASWSSSVPAVAMLNSSGLATGLMPGATNISATYGTMSASGVLTVIAPVLVSISVTPNSTLVKTGNSVQLTATGIYSDGSTQNLTSAASWSTSASNTATANAGLVTGIADGTATITASEAGITSAAATVQVGTPADFYVATNGNDSWSGTLFTPNSGNTDGPFATIAKAQSAVQSLIKNSAGRTNPVAVLVRQGTFFGQSLTFTSADSGTSTLGVVWGNYPNEAPVISGGVQLTGWINTGGNSYQISLPSTTLYFENLFYNGQRRLRPRTGGYLGTYARVASTIYLSGGAPPASAPTPNCSLYVSGKGWECFDRFQANCADVNGSWENLSPPYPIGDIELIDFELWTDSKLRIQSIDQNCVVHLTGPTNMAAATHGFIVDHRYIVENVKDAFNQPGQWFLDRSTSPWQLTYLANQGENPNTDVVVIPQSAQVMTANNLQYVTFQGLTFQNDNYIVPAVGYPSTQQDPNISAAVACYNCEHVTFNSDIVTQTSGMGMEFSTNNSSLTTTNNVFENGALYDIGGSPIRVGKPPASSDTDANVPQFTTIQNNLLEGYGRIFPSGVGIIQGSGHDNTYTHNDIYDGYHAGVEICLPPSCAPGKKNSSGTFNIVVSFNHVFNLFEGITDDSGAIYFSTGGTGYSPSGNQILNNKIHDLTDASVMDPDGYGGFGIYLDSYTGLVNVENNLVYRTSGTGVKITNGSPLANEANTITNNIISYPRLGGISNNYPYGTGGTACPATVPRIFNATNNLFYFDRQSTSVPAMYMQEGCDYTCGASITALHNWQNNLYWRINGAFDTDTKAFHVQPKAGTPAICTVGTNTWTFYTFSGWQGLGEDTAGSANTNPGFNNPVYPGDDYSLPNGSPNAYFVVFDPTQPGRTNPVIKPTNPLDVSPTFLTEFYNPATDY